MANFDGKKKEFESLKAKSKQELHTMKEQGKLQTLGQQWQKELEMKLDGDENLVEFNQLKASELKDIEHFLQILNDWVQETSHDLESYQPPAEEEYEFKRATRNHSSQQLFKA